ncbi:atrazine chlorohydrolase [mine drainage metagenome]|uniref:Atrazine chlorohydrolase n=1 Tax=mine drainage metagenome TaxID=410659 RepID=T0YB23_9ZZZZ
MPETGWHGWVLPGLVNAHAHAFQRAMAGLAEHRVAHARDAQDSFWSWRETMYAFAARLDPETLHAVAAQAYVEMLEAGYTQVCEFHYLHHAPDGRPYAPVTAMSAALIAAARETGIGLTLLPTLYMAGGFDRRPLAARQQRFAHTLDAFLDLLTELRAQQGPELNVGIALHSLRAVPPEALAALLESGLAARGPLHIHIAEQTVEIDDCLAARGQRPVAWLLDHAPIDARWCLVHATHMDTEETVRLARSGAVVALCPSTEANLGDGLFSLDSYLDAGGRIAIGSDSNISISPVEELRWLEYGQRLIRRARNLAASAQQSHTGTRLYALALAGGRQAAGLDAAPQDAALLHLDAAHVLLAERRPEEVLDSWIFAGNAALVRDVCVGGALGACRAPRAA